jgi:mannose-6-phosphate isomerase-like protein (cupin superfamily)
VGKWRADGPEVGVRYKYKLDTSREIGRPSISGHPHGTHDDLERLSCGLFHIDGGRHGLIRNERADRLHLVLEGSGRFMIAGESLAIQAGDVIIVPRQTPYDYERRMKLFLMHAPADRNEWDTSLEDPPRPETPPTPPDAAI